MNNKTLPLSVALLLFLVVLLLTDLVLAVIGCSQHQPTPTDQVVTLTVDYDRSVEAGVRAGNYDYADPDITSGSFPAKEIGTKEIQLHLKCFGKYLSTNHVLAELDKQNLRPANLQELLAFGEQHPDVQREFPIIALGSVWRDFRGRRCCPCLRSFSSERYLYLDWFDYGWYDVCRFAAVSK